MKRADICRRNFGIEVATLPPVRGNLSNLPHFSTLEGGYLRRSSWLGTFFVFRRPTYVGNLRIGSAVNASMPNIRCDMTTKKRTLTPKSLK
jgi:hypothetical protein